MLGEVVDVEHIVIAGVAAVAGSGVGAWLLKSYQVWRENERTERKDAWDRQAELIDRLDKHVEQLQLEQRRAVESEAVCRQEMARLRALGGWLYGLLQSHHATLERLSPSPVEPLPAFPDFGVAAIYDEHREFHQREAEHTTQLLREQVKVAQEQIESQGNSKTKGASPPPAKPSGDQP